MAKNKYYVDNREMNESQFIYEVEENINNYVETHFYEIVDKNFPAYKEEKVEQYVKKLIELSNGVDFEDGFKTGKKDTNGISPSVILEKIDVNSDEAYLFSDLYNNVANYYLAFAQVRKHMKIKNKKDCNITYYTKIY